MRLIDADALEPDADYDDGDYWAVSIAQIQSAPTIDPERKKGKWIDNETSYADGVRQTCTCSVCGQRSVRPLGRFCRWCGADMRGESDDIPIEYFESGGI